MLEGGAGDDTLSGGRGKDLLNGGSDDDTLTGGRAADTFEFVAGFGHDLVTDFDGDLIRMDSAVFANFADVLGHAAQVGADTVITFDAANSITLQNVVLADLGASDFQFVP